MEAKRVSTQIIDHVDGQPSIVLSNGNWGVFDPKTNMYKDTGIKASPEDDSSAVKYYKLNNVPTPPEAPSQTGGWNTLASLNASLAQAGWSEDPLQTESTNRFCWIATYGKENIVDTVATEAEGHLVFKPKFTRTNVRLWSNYANSPTISVVGNEIIITNPDGTVIKQKFASTEAINDLTTLINSLQSQVDGAIYSYSMEGVPSLNTPPTTDWRLDSSGDPITDPATIADVYRTHVGDTYTDLLTYRSYRFSQTGSSSSNPSHYEWKIIEDDALSAALGEIAQLGREKITVFTEQPNKPYKKGDMWLDGEVMLHAIQSSEVFNMAHWVQPYATKVELDAVETALQAAAADATLAKDNLATLESNLTSMTGTVADAIKDNIISDTELLDLNAELKQLDIDQETLLTTVNYLLNSIYLPATPKATLQTRSNNSIAVGGSMDIYQAQISTMIADRVITEQERADYLSKFNAYKNDLKLLNEAISGASSAIEGELKRLADEKVDNIEIGGRNLILNSTKNTKGYSGSPVYLWSGLILLSEKLIVGQKYTFSIGNIEGAEFDYISLRDSSDGRLDVQSRNILGFTPNIEDLDRLYIYYKNYPESGNITVSNIKLEKGTKPTDWSPAPEDVQADIDGVSSSLTDLVGTTKSALEDSIIDKTERAKITELDRALDIEQERLISTVWAIKENPNLDMITEGLLNKASDDVLKAGTGSIDKLQAQLQVILAKTKVTEADKNSYTTLYNTFKTTMKALEIAIINAQEAISKNSIDNIEIGGRNLLLNSSFNNRPNNFLNNAEELEYSYNRVYFKSSGVVGKHSGVWFDMPYYFVNGEKYTLSFNVISDKNITLNYIGLRISRTQGSSQAGSGGQLLPHIPLVIGDNNVSFVFTANYIEEQVGLIIGLNIGESVGLEFSNIKLEKGSKATDWTPAPEDIQAEIDSGVATVTTLYKHANEGVAVTKPTAESEVADGWSETSPAKIDGQVIWSVNRVTLKNGTKVYSNPANIQGADGEGGINVMITRQGSFRTYWRQIGDQGQILTTPEKVSEIVGGVEIGGVKYVQCKVLIYKGSVDVTASALADPTTLPKWYLNNELMGSVTDTLNIPIIHADGEDDEVRFEYTDTNAKNWKGA